MNSQFDYTTLENYDKTEFEIEGTKLVKYTGKNKKVKVPEGVTSIGAEAFKNCDWITEIYIPYGVHDIDYSAFQGCKNIREVEIPIRALKQNTDVIKYFGERYKEIEYGLGCGDSEDIPRLPKFFEELGLNETTKEKQEGINLDINFAKEDPLIKDALNLYLTEMLVTDHSLSKKLHISCDRARDIIEFLEKNRFIGPHKERSLVREIYITADIYKSLFGEEPCTVEEAKIDYDSSEFEIEGTILTQYKGDGREVKIPQGITTIGNAAFLFCGKLTDVRIPNSVETIGDGAFMQCGELKNINIPESVKTIGTRAFEGCYPC